MVFGPQEHELLLSFSVEQYVQQVVTILTDYFKCCPLRVKVAARSDDVHLINEWCGFH